MRSFSSKKTHTPRDAEICMRILPFGERLFVPQVGPDVRMLGVVQRGLETGALAQLADGSYAQVNGDIVQPLNPAALRRRGARAGRACRGRKADRDRQAPPHDSVDLRGCLALRIRGACGLVDVVARVGACLTATLVRSWCDTGLPSLPAHRCPTPPAGLRDVSAEVLCHAAVKPALGLAAGLDTGVDEAGRGAMLGPCSAPTRSDSCSGVSTRSVPDRRDFARAALNCR